MNIQRCPRCGWPEAEPFEIVSRHETSEGAVVYTRCACGRLLVRRADATAPVLASRSASLAGRERRLGGRRCGALGGRRCGALGGRRFGALGGLAAGAVGALVAVAATALPVTAVAACGVLGLAVGVLAWMWAWLTGPAGALGFAVRAGVCGGVAGLALGGLTVVVQAATVAVVAALSVLVGLWLWTGRAAGRRPC